VDGVKVFMKVLPAVAMVNAKEPTESDTVADEKDHVITPCHVVMDLAVILLLFAMGLALPSYCSGEEQKELYNEAYNAVLSGKFDEALQLCSKGIIENPNDAKLWFGLGVVYRASKECDKAVGAFQNAIRLNAGPFQHIAYAFMGDCYEALQRHEEAVDARARAQAIEVSTKADELYPNYAAYITLSIGYMRANRYGDAVEALQEAAQLNPRAPDIPIRLGWVFLQLKRYKDALAEGLKAVELDPKNGFGHILMGISYGLLGQDDKAAIVPECAICFLAMGVGCRLIGDQENALKALETSISLARKSGDAVTEGRALAQIGMLDAVNERDVSAEDNFNKALHIFRQHNMRQDEGTTLKIIGDLYRSVGYSGKALEYYAKTLAVLQELDLPELTLSTYVAIGTLSSNGEERIRYSKLALDFADRKGLSHSPDLRGSFLTLVLDRTTDEETKEAYTEKLGRLVDTVKDKENICFTRFDYARALESMGKEQEAIVQFKTVCREASDFDVELKAYSLYCLAHLTAKVGDALTAKGYYLQTIAMVQDIKGRAQSVSHNLYVHQIAQPLYAETVDLLVSLGEAENAFAYSEMARESALIDLLQNRPRVGLKNANLLDREKALRVRTFVLDETIMEYRRATKIDPGVEIVEAERERVRGEHALLLDAINKEDPELFSLLTVSSLSLREVQDLLDGDTTLLEYFSTPEKTFLWVLSKSAFKLLEVRITSKNLEDKIRAFREKISKLVPDYEPDARTLYDLLIRPAKPYIKTRRLAIVPHFQLHYLPFQALLNSGGRDGGKEGHFLAEEYDVFYLPSASVLRFLPEKRKRLTGRIIAFANPYLGDESLDLPFAEEEATGIRKTFSKTAVYMKRNATKDKAISLSSAYNAIHFATHAELNSENPLSSSVRLAKDDGNDGRLTVGDIFGLDLGGVALVTLSGCETGLGKLRAGDELVGLSRGFMYAGAPSVVASLWRVNDESTAKFMTLFYRNLKHHTKVEALRLAQLEMIKGKAGKGIVRGIGGITSQSKTPKLLQEPAQTVNGSHPYFWAPFILTGDWK